MSLLYPQSRFRRRAIWLLMFAAVYGGVKLLSAWTGFGAWIEATPAALAVYRIFAVLFFAGIGAIAFFVARTDQRPSLYRLIGALFFLIGTLHAVLLFTGASGPSDLFPE